MQQEMGTGQREERDRQQEAAVRIEGEKVFLRPMEEQDTGNIVRWRNSSRVRCCFIYREDFTPESHQKWTDTMIHTGRAIQFILCEKESRRPVGSVYFRDIDDKKQEAEYGIFIGEESAAGRGYGSEAARLAVEYAFKQLGLEKVVLRVFTDNIPAIKSYEKAGFVKEGILKAVECSDGERKDMFFMSVEREKEKLISFVIPCYRSASTLTGVVAEIKGSMELLQKEGKLYSYEVILVNDSSPDDTFAVIRGLCREDEKIRGINLAKNFGQHAALMAGFRFVRGDIVVCLDDDGQTPADEVGKLLAAIEEGQDVVYAKYEHKKHSLFRNFGTYMNEEMAKVMLGKPKDLYVSSYFAARRFVIEDMKKYTNAYPYVIGLVLRTTHKISNVTVAHREREVGVSGYTFRKLLGLWFNGFTAFSVKPLRIATAIGCTCSAIGFLYGIYTIVKKLVNPNVPLGFSSLMAAIVFMGGMTMIMLGLVGEYVGRMYISMNNSPQYVIRETVNGEER
ncbi:MAG: GNAT family N-acetyltransferase [Lachnospiraceae bacterium]|nr:GNAT family N-acetyltransferase [Lachnospiraceae bacterium]